MAATRMDNEVVPPSSAEDTGQSTTRNTPTATPSSNTRKSGRATRKPELFSQGSYSGDQRRVKRKRPNAGDGDEGEVDGEEEDEEEESDTDNDNDQEPDEEELREKKRGNRKASTKKPKGQQLRAPSGGKGASRAPKKTKVSTSNGVDGQSLAIRSATDGKRKAATSRPKKPKVRPSLAAGESGLYGMYPVIFWPVAFFFFFFFVCLCQR